MCLTINRKLLNLIFECLHKQLSKNYIANIVTNAYFLSECVNFLDFDCNSYFVHTLFMFQYEKNTHKMSIVSGVKKNRRIPT